jgi:hypothetical protein
MKIIVISLLALLAMANILMFGMPQGQKAQIIYTDITHQDKTISIALNDGKVIYVGSPEHTYVLIDKETKLESLNGFQLTEEKIELNKPGNFTLYSKTSEIQFTNGIKNPARHLSTR